MNAFWNNILSVLESFRIADALDILAVAFIIYYAIRLVRETRAMQLVKSLGVIFAVYFFATQLGMVTLTFVIKSVLDVGLIMIVVLFQPELRRALERIGRSKLTDLGRLSPFVYEDREATKKLIDVLCESAEAIIAQEEGALIVLERVTRLGEIVATGTEVDAIPSVELISNIFFINSPLHDGAMIIRGDRIIAAGCFLPLSENDELGKELGTRHRAALGISEVSDAITIVVSEERGTISVSQDGKLMQGLSSTNLKKYLRDKLLEEEPQDKNKKSIFKFWGKNND